MKENFNLDSRTRNFKQRNTKINTAQPCRIRRRKKMEQLKVGFLEILGFQLISIDLSTYKKYKTIFKKKYTYTYNNNF
jgi:hypothetical protein